MNIQVKKFKETSQMECFIEPVSGEIDEGSHHGGKVTATIHPAVSYTCKDVQIPILRTWWVHTSFG